VADKAPARSADQGCSKTTLALRPGHTLPGTTAVLGIAGLRTVRRLAVRCLLLTIRCWRVAGVIWLLRVGVLSTVLLLMGCAVALLRVATAIVWLLWVAGLIPLPVLRLGGVIVMLLRGRGTAIWRLLLPTAVIFSASHGDFLVEM
jgi:hypothetical protein